MKKIERHLSKPEHYENNHSINIICPMANAFQKYWARIKEFSEIASILDPRLKLQYLQFSLVKQHGVIVADEKLTISRNRFVSSFVFLKKMIGFYLFSVKCIFSCLFDNSN
jgi:hypothetical protein